MYVSVALLLLCTALSPLGGASESLSKTRKGEILLRQTLSALTGDMLSQHQVAGGDFTGHSKVQGRLLTHALRSLDASSAAVLVDAAAGPSRRQSGAAGTLANREPLVCGTPVCSSSQCGTIGSQNLYCSTPRYDCEEETGTCTRQTFLGESCAPGDQCINPSATFGTQDSYSLQCRSGICVEVELRHAGEDCTVDGDCKQQTNSSWEEAPVSCIDGKCAFVPDNGACYADDNCLSTSSCEYNYSISYSERFCLPHQPDDRVPLGSACDYDVDCQYAGLCIASRCTAPASLAVGANCSGASFSLFSELYACQKNLTCSSDICTEWQPPPVDDSIAQIIQSTYGDADACADTNCTGFGESCQCVNNSGIATCVNLLRAVLAPFIVCMEEQKLYQACVHRYASSNSLSGDSDEVEEECERVGCCCTEANSASKCVIDTLYAVIQPLDGSLCMTKMPIGDHCATTSTATVAGTAAGGSTSTASDTGVTGTNTSRSASTSNSSKSSSTFSFLCLAFIGASFLVIW